MNPAGAVVVDASAIVDLLMGASTATWIREHLTGRSVAAPAHLGSEVLSALARKHREGALGPDQVESMLRVLGRMPIEGHAAERLLVAAWHRRGHLRVSDALYVELADRLDTVLVTTDRRLARATPLAVAPPG